MNADIQARLPEILKRHAAWLENRLEGTRANLRDANLAGADLSAANLRDANLQGADLQGANLTGANLRAANLARANLSNAYLQGTYLVRANLSNADLQGTYLARANLAGANLRGANLAGAYLVSVITDRATRVLSIAPIGSRADSLVAVLQARSGANYERIQTGCFVGSIEEFAKAVDGAYPDGRHGREYRAAIALLMEIRADVFGSTVPQ